MNLIFVFVQNKTEKELKELRDKFIDLQARHTEAKSQLDITKQELKKTQKVQLIGSKQVDFSIIFRL